MKLLPLLLGFVLTGCACSKPETSEFGKPLFVNGRRVTDDEIKLALIYGPGRLMLDLRKTDLLIENEIARQARVLAHIDAAELKRNLAELHAKYRVSDEEFEAEYEYNIEEFRQGYPTLDINAEVCRAFRSVDWYREQVRQTLAFDHVFLPEDPAQWPACTLAAVKADPGGGEALLTDAQQSYQQRLNAATKSTDQLPREDPLYKTYLRQIVRDVMFSAITFKTHPDGIDSKLALWADCDSDGKPELTVTIEELWEQMSDTVTETEIDQAKQWYITSLATHDRLEKDGALLAERERKAALAEYARSLETMTTTLEQVATRVDYFPSVEAFTQYYALKMGFERLIAAKLADDSGGGLSPILREYVQRANQVMGFGAVDSDVLLVSAMDLPRFRWKKDGWFQARRKAQRLREQFDKNPTPECWSRLMDEHSEYWDPPPPEYHEGRPSGGSSDIGRKKKGRFGSRYRNDLISYVGESAYSEWVTGECITDRMFFDQAEGSVAGPFRGPLGWYLTRVNKRIPPRRPLDLGDPKNVQLLKDDYLRSSFNQYSKEAVAQAEIKGWEPL